MCSWRHSNNQHEPPLDCRVGIYFWGFNCRNSSSSHWSRCLNGLSGRSSSKRASAFSSTSSVISPLVNSLRQLREICCSVSKLNPLPKDLENQCHFPPPIRVDRAAYPHAAHSCLLDMPRLRFASRPSRSAGPAGSVLSQFLVLPRKHDHRNIYSPQQTDSATDEAGRPPACVGSEELECADNHLPTQRPASIHVQRDRTDSGDTVGSWRRCGLIFSNSSTIASTVSRICCSVCCELRKKRRRAACSSTAG